MSLANELTVMSDLVINEQHLKDDAIITPAWDKLSLHLEADLKRIARQGGKKCNIDLRENLRHGFLGQGAISHYMVKQLRGHVRKWAHDNDLTSKDPYAFYLPYPLLDPIEEISWP